MSPMPKRPVAAASLLLLVIHGFASEYTPRLGRTLGHASRLHAPATCPLYAMWPSAWVWPSPTSISPVSLHEPSSARSARIASLELFPAVDAIPPESPPSATAGAGSARAGR